MTAGHSVLYSNLEELHYLLHIFALVNIQILDSELVSLVPPELESCSCGVIAGQEIIDSFAIDLEEGAINREGSVNGLLVDPGVESMDHPRDQPLVLIDAFHGVGFATSCLAIRENSGVVAFSDFSD